MAESSERTVANKSNDLTENFDDFCRNFNFLFRITPSETCCHCNGFYGPNCDQPLCVSCHKFLFASRKRKRIRDSLDTMAYKYYRYGHCSNHVPQSVTPSSSLQLKDLNKFFSEFVQTQKQPSKHKSSENACSKRPTTIPTDANVKFEVASDTHISSLPVEMLLKIFSNLNEITLLQASKVSKHWQQILDTQQDMWKTYTKKRWPLLQRTTEPTSWLQMYTALESSCCCRICANEVMQKAGNASLQTTARRRAERDILARFEISGIRAVPLDGKLARWQASIVGPADSPYEGGTFYLYIYMPFNYPFEPLVIRFLTKIIHPNISRHGDIGLDIITWNCCFTLIPMLISIQSLLCDPFTKVCMEPELGLLYDQDRPRFDALARHWTKKYAMMDEIGFDDEN